MRSLSQLPFTCFMPVWVRSGCGFCWWMLARQTEWKGQLCLSARALQMQPHRNVICPSRITCRPGRHLTDFETFHFGKNHIRQQYLKPPVFCKFHWSSNSSMNCLKIIWKSALTLYIYISFFFAYPHSLKNSWNSSHCDVTRSDTFLTRLQGSTVFYCSLT